MIESTERFRSTFVRLKDREVTGGAGMTDAYNLREIKRGSHEVEGDRAVNEHAIDGSEAQLIFADLERLRNRIIAAWQDRALMLSSDEQRDLRDRIQRTCELLQDFVAERVSEQRTQP